MCIALPLDPVPYSAIKPYALYRPQARALPRPKLLCSALSSGLVPSHAIRPCVLLCPQALYSALP